MISQVKIIQRVNTAYCQFIPSMVKWSLDQFEGLKPGFLVNTNLPNPSLVFAIGITKLFRS